MLSKNKNLDKQREKKEKKELKKELKNVDKSIIDILPICNIEDDFIQTRYGYNNIYQIESKDVYSLNEDEMERHICDFSNFLKYYQDDFKIVCMQFPVNTEFQQQNMQKKISQTNNTMYTYFLNKRLKELEYLEQHRYNKEFFIFIYAKDKNSFIEKENLLLRISSDSVAIKQIDLDKKIKILFKLNNQNSKI